MITPGFALTATERVLPTLFLNFTNASLDSRVTFTRSGNTATTTNSSGVIALVNADTPRFDYNPTTLVCQGLLVEESRTNVLLNSLIDGTSLSTQTVTVTAAARTLSFYGTGTIVISGTHTATVVGTGAYPTRTTYTFTPTAGALILTVTGTVQFAQLELGSFATSFIPTAGSQVTRTADTAVMTSTNFSSWFNATQGSFTFTGDTLATGTVRPGIFVSKTVGSGSLYFKTPRPPGTTGITVANDAGATAADLSGSAITVNTAFTVCGGYKENDFGFADRGAATTVDTSGSIPTSLDRMGIGFDFGTTYQNGHIASIKYWIQKLTTAEIQAFSK